jgi:hypothetical protein
VQLCHARIIGAVDTAGHSRIIPSHFDDRWCPCDYGASLFFHQLSTGDFQMSSPIVTDIENAAIPAVVAALQAVQAFSTNIGVDPTKWALTVPGALTVLLGTLQLQIPVLAQSEVGALQTQLNTHIAAAIAALQAKAAAATAPAAA